MKNYQRNYQSISTMNVKTILDFFNNAKSSKEIEDVLNKSKNVSDPNELSESIIAHRKKLAGFTDIDQIIQFSGLDNQELSNLFSAFEKQNSLFVKEALQHVMWVHGSSLHVENPEAFGGISKMKNGTRITGLTEFGELHESFVHFAIPTPTFSSENRFYLRSIMVIWRTSLTTHSRGPFVNVVDAEFWDGHQLLAINPSIDITYLSNGYLITRFIINSNEKINFGIGASFKQIIEVDGSSSLGWAEYASVGAEFVTRSRGSLVSF